MPTNNTSQLLTIEQLAEQLTTSIRHIRRLIAERRIPYIKVGHLIRFDPAEITDWLNNSRRACLRNDDAVRGAARPYTR
jgi:excisionase family DNA binding protein